MTTNDWFFPAGWLAADGWEVVVDATIEGWSHTGLRVGDLASGDLALAADDVERVVVPLTGDVRVSWSGPDGEGTAELEGRESVFDGPADVAYLGPGVSATLSGAGRVAVAEAPATGPATVTVLRKADIPVEIRGAGSNTRQVHNFATPGALDARKIIACEVITPSENWSSFPPHKHDESVPGHELPLEEIYYFEAAPSRSGGENATVTTEPFGLFVSYDSPGGAIDTNARVRPGDVALVPFGYHGPAVAAPGSDLYYLNVMAGPEDKREWLVSEDPAQAGVRALWSAAEPDPRLPLRRDA